MRPVVVRAGRDDARDGSFPIAAGVLFGFGLGGFFDGIVLHQMLQWHHMLSSVYPLNSIENLELNTFWDGVFHSATYVLVVLGMFVLWRQAQRQRLIWSIRSLIGSLLVGWGAFNLVEGLIDHAWLGLHHVNETADRQAWIYWDSGFLLWGFAMLLAGWSLIEAARRHYAVRGRSPPA